MSIQQPPRSFIKSCKFNNLKRVEILNKILILMLPYLLQGVSADMSKLIGSFLQRMLSLVGDCELHESFVADTLSFFFRDLCYALSSAKDVFSFKATEQYVNSVASIVLSDDGSFAIGKLQTAVESVRRSIAVISGNGSKKRKRSRDTLGDQ